MKYEGSPFGKMSGAIAGQVTSSWKGIKYGRAYVIPNNPQSVNQTLQRTIFKNISEFGRRIVDTILNPYTLPAPKLMSAFNKFVSINTKLQTGLTILYNLIKITTGGLYNPGILSFACANTGDLCVFEWEINLVGEALSTDLGHAVVYNETQDKFFFGSPTARSEGGVTVIATGANLNDVMHGWIFFVNALGTIVSDSAYATDVVA